MAELSDISNDPTGLEKKKSQNFKSIISVPLKVGGTPERICQYFGTA